MVRLAVQKTSFTAGEISPRLLGRGDLRAYQNGATTLRNVVVHPTGGVSRRPGLRHVAMAAGAGRLVSFEFNTEQVYLLAFSDSHVDVYREDVWMAQIATPWTTDQIAQLTWVQSADTLFVAHPDVPTKKITRTSHVDWTIEDLAYYDEQKPAEGGDPARDRIQQPHHKFAKPDVTLQASATGGSVTLNASAAHFVAGHVGKVDEWASDQFTVARSREFRDPSMLARGIGANITGSRADVVICDDVEVPNTSDTAPKREDLRARLDETDFVLVPGGLSIFVGTPHTYHSIYAREPRTAAGEEAPYLHGYKRLEVPVLDGTGQSEWPERFPLGRIAAMRKRAGPNKFASQMLLLPVDLADGRLDPDKLRHYDAELDYREGNGEALLFLGSKRLVSATCWWDPAYGAPGRGDASVVAVVFTDEDGAYWLHAVEYLEHDPRAVHAVDEATQLCRQAVQVVRRNFLPAITLETNGLGRFLPGLLRREIAAAGIEAAVIEHTSTRPKDLRILDAFDAVLAAGRLNAHRRVWDTPFVSEMREWRPAAGLQDDGLDAVAGCLLAEPVRLPRRTTADVRPRRNWRAGARPVTAKSEFRP